MNDLIWRKNTFTEHSFLFKPIIMFSLKYILRFSTFQKNVYDLSCKYLKNNSKIHFWENCEHQQIQPIMILETYTWTIFYYFLHYLAKNTWWHNEWIILNDDTSVKWVTLLDILWYFTKIYWSNILSTDPFL